MTKVGSMSEGTNLFEVLHGCFGDRDFLAKDVVAESKKAATKAQQDLRKVLTELGLRNSAGKVGQYLCRNSDQCPEHLFFTRSVDRKRARALYSVQNHSDESFNPRELVDELLAIGEAEPRTDDEREALELRQEIVASELSLLGDERMAKSIRNDARRVLLRRKDQRRRRAAEKAKTVEPEPKPAPKRPEVVFVAPTDGFFTREDTCQKRVEHLREAGFQCEFTYLTATRFAIQVFGDYDDRLLEKTAINFLLRVHRKPVKTHNTKDVAESYVAVPAIGYWPEAKFLARDADAAPKRRRWRLRDWSPFDA